MITPRLSRSYCIYCGALATTRDHVPPKVLLDQPFPPNLRTVPSCGPCNNGASLDEQYFLVLLGQFSSSPSIEAKLAPGGLIDRTLSYSPALEERLLKALEVVDETGNPVIKPEMHRENRIVRKVATGLFALRYGRVPVAGVTRINGLGLAASMKILSEVGPNLSRFANVKHFCSWLGLCPGTKISGGKMLSSKTKRSGNRVRQALKIAAMSLSHSASALGAFYRRLSGRMDKPSANTATAHKLARMVYFMLTRGEAYVDQGQQHYEEQQRQRSIAALKRRATALGFQINPVAAPT